jgi:5S rRNA maturation endonuclease (ribonuclease M5)
MSLDVSRLDNVSEQSGKITAACPACREQGSDKSGDHLLIMPDGRYGCAAHPKNAEHRKRIYALAGMQPKPQLRNGKRILATYPYKDESGEVLFEVVRYEPKDFRQRKPDGRGGWCWGVKGARRVLYHLPEVISAVKNKTPVLLLEGEKDVDAARKIGFVATCNAGGAGKWLKDYSESLRGADVILVPDDDDPGRDHAEKVYFALAGIATRVRVLRLDKKDMADWIEARAGQPIDAIRDELQSIIDAAPEFITAEPDWMAKGISAAALGKMEVSPIRYLIKNMLPEGLCLLVGRPKIGKSWLGLDMALAVARGGRAIRTTAVEKSDVLYLALEDGERRMKNRLETISSDVELPGELNVFFDWPKMDEGGLTRLDEYLRRNPGCRFVIIDTLQKVKGKPGFNSNAYESDYAALSGLQRLALDRCACILLIHHRRKSGGDDILDSVSGSVGITGAADAILILERGRGDADAVLHITGRDVLESRLALQFAGGQWSLLGDVEEYAVADTRRKILEVLQSGPMLPKEISKVTGINSQAIRTTLYRMVSDQQITRGGDGRYTAPVTRNAVTRNASSDMTVTSLPRNAVTDVTPYLWEGSV